jgi:hypothetical protein
VRVTLCVALLASFLGACEEAYLLPTNQEIGAPVGANEATEVLWLALENPHEQPPVVWMEGSCLGGYEDNPKYPPCVGGVFDYKASTIYLAVDYARGRRRALAHELLHAHLWYSQGDYNFNHAGDFLPRVEELRLLVEPF